MPDKTRLQGIQMRLRAAQEAAPGPYWLAALGSGECAMTAVYAETEKGERTFVCDVLPDYMVSDESAWERRIDMLGFLSNAPTDIQYLLAALAAPDPEQEVEDGEVR